MEDISITTPLGSKIKGAVHDILCYTDGTDIVVIGDVGSWGDTLSDLNVFYDIQSWIQTVAELKNCETILQQLNNVEFIADTPNRSIVKLLIILFDLLTPESKIVQKALNDWIEAEAQREILLQLDLWMKELLNTQWSIISTPEKLKEPETAEHQLYLYNLYNKRRHERMETIA